MDMLRVLFVICVSLETVAGDYPCVCNYNVEAAVHLLPNDNSEALGYMYEFDCKPAGVGQGNGNYLVIMFEGKIGYVQQGADIQSQTCPGAIPSTDLVTSKTHNTTTATFTTTSPATTTPSTPITTTSITNTSITTTTPTTTTTSTTTTTPKPTTTPTTTTTATTTTTPTTTTTLTTTTNPSTTTTPRPTTTPMATTTTTRRSTTQTTTLTTSNSTAATVLEGHIQLCPDLVKNSIHTVGGFLDQYGSFCFELINNPTQWHNAQRHCKDTGGGYLTHVHNKAEQDYIVRFLDKHHNVQSIWLGLTDSKQEGQWSWISGDPVTYTNFGQDYKHHNQSTHNNNDCVIMKQGGDWTDVPCGLAFISGSLGDKNPFICQYKIVPPDIMIG